MEILLMQYEELKNGEKGYDMLQMPVDIWPFFFPSVLFIPKAAFPNTVAC